MCRAWKACPCCQANPAGIWEDATAEQHSGRCVVAHTPGVIHTPAPGCAFPQCAVFFAGPKAWPGGMGLISFFAVTVFLQALVADISTKV